ncbi:Phosphoacetylglucosamine mutase [Babesia sp. Xinjiang]|uniref:Phosphoacetylglucosamine mutase n=1 Tax=Babesia sp. Xinjiang TaxID=462227 RepID=UPI000A259EE3|nr:Phosphoacetylglucosamine mutase [Babesia sp. Xinjiang]ORM40282.1 Phosphoacetylglucosamine mutase [Babesia sp. Xinjiang]
MSNAGDPQVAGNVAEGKLDIELGPGIPSGYVDLDYGTCGFRGVVDTPPNHLDHVVYRCGALLAALPFLRNPKQLYHVTKVEEGSQCVRSNEHNQPPLAAGAIITASHNEASENGIKLLEGNGYMIDSSWEATFTELVNFHGDWSNLVFGLMQTHRLGPVRRNCVEYRILIGHDTRASSPHLSTLFKAGVEAMAAALMLERTTCVELGVVTSPTVSFLLKNGILFSVNDREYVEALKDAFNDTLDTLVALGHVKGSLKTDRHRSLFYDCSYGVGGCVVYKFFDCLRKIAVLPHLCNSPAWSSGSSQQMLNNGCGTHYVFSTMKPPASVERHITIYEGQWFCSLDGDADRLIYFKPHKRSIRLIDGVRLLVVKMKFLRFALKGWNNCKEECITVGVLLNHYTNGGAINYIKGLISEWNTLDSRVKWAIEFCRVGVKNMQAKAQGYHISIFYEANGHGNILFNIVPPLYDTGKKCGYDQLLANVARIFNNPTGDSIANSLFIELALHTLKLSHNDVLEFYKELPYINATARIPPAKRRMFRTNPDNDTVLDEPYELNRLLELSVAKFEGSRAFIRPSGTEAVCRIYAEASTEDHARMLAMDITNHVKLFL